MPDDLLAVRGGEALAVKAGAMLGIVDLKTNRLEHANTTGRGAVKFGKVLGSVVLSAALTAGSAVAAYGAASPGTFYSYPVYSPTMFLTAANSEMLADPEGGAVYALNTFSDDVTILDANTGKSTAKIPVGSGCMGIRLTPNGRFVVAHSPGQITLIDTQSRKRVLEHKLQEETVNAVYTLRQTPRIVALASHSLVVIDAESGKLVRTLEKFGDPIRLLEPGQP